MRNLVVPPHWLTLMDVLREHPKYSVSLWFNPNVDVAAGFTAQVMDGKGGFAPPIKQGAIWSVFARNPVKALNDLAHLVHKAVAR